MARLLVIRKAFLVIWDIIKIARVLVRLASRDMPVWPVKEYGVLKGLTNLIQPRGHVLKIHQTQSPQMIVGLILVIVDYISVTTVV